MDGVSIVGYSMADYSPLNRGNSIATGHGYYRSSRVDFIDVFYRALRQWVSETIFESNLDVILSHPSFRTIVAMGQRAVPLIVDELKRRPSLIAYALEAITGEQPYPANTRGNIRAMSDHWVLWSEREDVAA